jgi:hypothetical protein
MGYKDRVILAADLLHMDPDVLLSKLDPDAPPNDTYTWIGWESEADLGNDDDRDDVYYITIINPEGDEYAIIVHRTCDGKYPLDGPGAQSKVRRAEHIVAALNRDER